MDFERIMKEKRIKQGMSQQGLADAAGVTKRAIAYWEKGERTMSIESADKVFKALHITVQIGEMNRSNMELERADDTQNVELNDEEREKLDMSVSTYSMPSFSPSKEVMEKYKSMK